MRKNAQKKKRIEERDRGKILPSKSEREKILEEKESGSCKSGN
jgi:hypothetical protein